MDLNLKKCRERKEADQMKYLDLSHLNQNSNSYLEKTQLVNTCAICYVIFPSS